MSSNWKARATVLIAALLVFGCSTPWGRERVGSEVNLSFTLQQNLIELPSVRVGGAEGRFILGTAAPRTVVDPGFERARAGDLSLGQRRTVTLDPVVAGIRPVADAIIGADAWENRAITIDYRSGLVTWQKDGIHAAYMTVYRYPAEPMIEIAVNGRAVAAVVDTANPDTLILPSSSPGRTTARVAIAGTDFGAVDVALADVSRARIGNRLLSRFLVSIDYGRRLVGLWRDPRIPLREPEG